MDIGYLIKDIHQIKDIKLGFQQGLTYHLSQFSLEIKMLLIYRLVNWFLLNHKVHLSFMSMFLHRLSLTLPSQFVMSFGSLHFRYKTVMCMIRTCIILNYGCIRVIVGVWFSLKGMCVCVLGVHTGNTGRVGMLRNSRSQQLSDVRNNRCH